MTKTKLTKIIIDILMYADFIYLMSHGTVRNLSLHAYMLIWELHFLVCLLLIIF